MCIAWYSRPRILPRFASLLSRALVWLLGPGVGVFTFALGRLVQ
jgi:hypothetical protein